MIHVYDGQAVLRRRFENDPLGRGPRKTFTEMLTLPRSDIAIWCFEGRASLSERRSIFPGYKQRPSTMTDGLYALINLTRDALKHTRALQVEVPHREADDVIAEVCRLYGQSQDMTVYTVDRDLKALEGGRVRVDVSQLKIVVDKLDPTKDRIVEPRFIRLYKALCGDQSDRVPGLSGFGPLTFAKCDWPLLQNAMEALAAGQVHKELFLRAGITEATAERICKPETVAHLKACWEIVGFLPLPDDWQQHIRTGAEDPRAGDQVLKQFMH